MEHLTIKLSTNCDENKMSLNWDMAPVFVLILKVIISQTCHGRK